MANVISQAEAAIKAEYGKVSQLVALHPKITMIVSVVLIVISNLVGVFRHI